MLGRGGGGFVQAGMFFFVVCVHYNTVLAEVGLCKEGRAGDCVCWVVEEVDFCRQGCVF